MRAAGKAGALMAGRAVRETVTLAGRAERARLARAFVEGVLGSGHPCGDVAALLVGELFSNSLRHSGSGTPGETVTVAVKTLNGVIRVEVTDRSGRGCQNRDRLAATRKTAGGSTSLPASHRGGAGEGAAGGPSRGSSFRTPADVSARRLAGDVPGVYLSRARVPASARCDAGRRRLAAWPGIWHVHRRYICGRRHRVWSPTCPPGR